MRHTGGREELSGSICGNGCGFPQDAFLRHGVGSRQEQDGINLRWRARVVACRPVSATHARKNSRYLLDRQTPSEVPAKFSYRCGTWLEWKFSSGPLAMVLPKAARRIMYSDQPHGRCLHDALLHSFIHSFITYSQPCTGDLLMCPGYQFSFHTIKALAPKAGVKRRHSAVHTWTPDFVQSGMATRHRPILPPDREYLASFPRSTRLHGLHIYHAWASARLLSLPPFPSSLSPACMSSSFNGEPGIMNYQNFPTHGSVARVARSVQPIGA